jgi:hypothetical protein
MTEPAEQTNDQDYRKKIIELVNGLSNDAVYMASRDWFGTVMMGRPILAAPQNERQKRAFEELLDVGFVHGDVEGGVYGYRSTWDGRIAHGYCKAAINGPGKEN